MSHFATFKNLTDFSAEEMNSLKQHCYAQVVDVNGHHFFKGQDTDKYSQTKFTFRGKQYHMYRHQLSLFLKLKEDTSFDMNSWTEEMTTSHLCAKKKCIRQEHLHIEELDINMQRVHCVAQNRCGHHPNGVDCLI